MCGICKTERNKKKIVHTHADPVTDSQYSYKYRRIYIRQFSHNSFVDLFGSEVKQ